MTVIGTELRKSIAKTTTYRVRRGNGAAGSTLGHKYQDIFAYTVTADPKTPAQQANRSKFGDAMADALALTPEERQPYIIRAKDLLGWTWFNVFIHDYMLA